MDLHEAMSAGVFIEFRDALGNSAGTAVYFDWCDQPLPSVGDRISCPLSRAGARATHQLSGRVKHRSFDIQKQADGQPCVWVRLVVDIGSAERTTPRDRSIAARLCFSRN